MTEFAHTGSRPDTPSLPPEVQAVLDQEHAEERALLVEAWDLSAHYLRTEPGDEIFARLGADIWNNLEATIQQNAATKQPAPLRLVKAPLRLVKAPALRWTALAACIVLLIGIGLFLQRPVTVSAPYGNVATVELPDGSLVELNSGSSLSYPRNFSAEARTVALNGEAFFSVRKGAASFSVTTFNGTTTVLGTRFNVRAWKRDLAPVTDVTVESGRVRLTARGDADKFVTLEAGESARLVDRRDAPMLLEEANTGNALAWRDGSFKFANHPLGTVLTETERRFDVRIKVRHAHLLNDPVTIFLENPLAAEEILRDICEYNQYRYRDIPGGYEIYQPEAQ